MSTRSRSAPGNSPSVISTMVTALPRAAYTEPSSRPMYPPPTTRSDLGMSGRSSAPVESMTRGSSTFSEAGTAGVDPVARIAWSKCRTSSPSPVRVTVSVCGSLSRCEALNVLHLAKLREGSGAVRQSLDDSVLEGAKLREVDVWLTERHTPCSRVSRFAQKSGHMQQGLGRDAAAVHAHSTRLRFGIDERDAETQIGGQKCGGISAGAATDDDDLCGSHMRRGRAGTAGGRARSLPTWSACLTRPNRRVIIPATQGQTAARMRQRSNAESGHRQRRRSPGDRTTATTAT